VSELERLAAACLMPSFEGPDRPEWLRPWLEGGLGGVCLFATNVRDRDRLAALTASLRQAAPGLLVAIDEEGGDVTRLEVREGSSFPSALGLGVIDDIALTEAVGAAIALELAAVGVNLNLAPVADVNTNPENPVIGIRSFGSDPGLVARHACAFVVGTQSRGVAACVKHFPGHGDTRQDSHHELPVVEAPELLPFRAAVDAGVRAVMTAHIVVSSLDHAPATLSPAVLALLRDELGFGGAIVSDALDMRSIAGTIGIEEGAVCALVAGIDSICLGPAVGPEGLIAVHAAVVEAVRAGRIDEERLVDAARRVAALAAWPRVWEAGAADASIGAKAAARAVRVEGDVDAGPRPVVLECQPEPLAAAGETGASLGNAIRARCPEASVHAARAERDLDGLPTDGGRIVVVVRDAARHPWQQHISERLIALRSDAILVETGVPGWRPSRAVAVVETHGAGRASLEAAARLLVPADLASS
jgi:beta-N-acetylhexosaminidase